MEDIETIMKKGVACSQCEEVMPADLMEDSIRCPGCEVDEFNNLTDINYDILD